MPTPQPLAEKRVIKICPVVWFRGAWKTVQGTGSNPIFPWPNGKEKAIDHARTLLGEHEGEIHVCDNQGATVIETIQVGGASLVSQNDPLFASSPSTTLQLAT